MLHDPLWPGTAITINGMWLFSLGAGGRFFVFLSFRPYLRMGLFWKVFNTMLLRDGWCLQNGRIFGKIPKGWGDHFQSKNSYWRFWTFLSPRGPLVLPLVNPPACNKNLDPLYTGIYASWIIRRIIKPTWWPPWHGLQTLLDLLWTPQHPYCSKVMKCHRNTMSLYNIHSMSPDTQI